MSEFEYFICELIYEAANHSNICKKPEYKKHIAELSFLLAKEDVRRYTESNKIEWN